MFFRCLDKELSDAVCENLEMHKCYSQGNAIIFEEAIKNNLGKKDIKVFNLPN